MTVYTRDQQDERILILNVKDSNNGLGEINKEKYHRLFYQKFKKKYSINDKFQSFFVALIPKNP